jgi:hypothetical protein
MRRRFGVGSDRWIVVTVEADLIGVIGAHPARKSCDHRSAGELGHDTSGDQHRSQPIIAEPVDLHDRDLRNKIVPRQRPIQIKRDRTNKPLPSATSQNGVRGRPRAV